MAVIPKAADAHVDASTGMLAGNIPDLVAGEDLDVVSGAYINPADGLVYQSSGAAAGPGAVVHGFTPRKARRGQAITLLGPSTRFRYATGGLKPGQTLYLGAAKGTLEDAPTAGDARGVAFAMSPTDVVFARYAV